MERDATSSPSSPSAAACVTSATWVSQHVIVAGPEGHPLTTERVAPNREPSRTPLVTAIFWFSVIPPVMTDRKRRRVGKECRFRWEPYHEKNKMARDG